jgi:nifR3 family TIM-barrel protein
MARRYPKGPSLLFCEMVKMDALIRYDANTLRLLDYEKEMHPIGGQICGSKPSIAGKAASIIEELGFDVVDLNCGCPVDKITKDGSGSGMLKNPELIGEILSNMIAAVKIPVTVKIRAGWDENTINAPEIVKIAEKAGAKAICIHGRTRMQGYKGPANWDWIRACKEAAKDILVIGNGSIFDAKSAHKIFTETGCDAILLSRGTFGQPWLAYDIERYLLGETKISRQGEDYREALLAHFNHTASYQSDQKAMIEMRRVGCWYLKRGHGTRVLKEAIHKAKSLDEIHQLICAFPWEQVDFSLPEQHMEEECEVSGSC